MVLSSVTNVFHVICWNFMLSLFELAYYNLNHSSKSCLAKILVLIGTLRLHQISIINSLLACLHSLSTQLQNSTPNRHLCLTDRPMGNSTVRKNMIRFGGPYCWIYTMILCGLRSMDVEHLECTEGVGLGPAIHIPLIQVTNPVVVVGWFEGVLDKPCLLCKCISMVEQLALTEGFSGSSPVVHIPLHKHQYYYIFGATLQIPNQKWSKFYPQGILSALETWCCDTGIFKNSVAIFIPQNRTKTTGPKGPLLLIFFPFIHITLPFDSLLQRFISELSTLTTNLAPLCLGLRRPVFAWILQSSDRLKNNHQGCFYGTCMQVLSHQFLE
ncbi:hypothetical protein VP01_5298g1 [Puccinia sorghi]|uniref:Uncharacterized protein n=1 Tax=Puccinia sorghi TaxID=27349 RepID=A0A0L6UKC5_9BASI|nr:hypothetical protein VP01_5298g1 [Puccinia sorghi]